MESYFVSKYERMQKSNWKMAISLENYQLWPRKKDFQRWKEESIVSYGQRGIVCRNCVRL